MFYNIFFIILLAGAIWCAWRISVADWRRRIIPDAYLFPLILIGLVVINFYPWPTTPPDAAVAACGGYALAAIIGFLFERVMHKKTDTIAPIGMGDIKLMVAGGIWLGTYGLAIALAIACIAGMIWGRIYHQKYIPLAPFFIGGGILSLITITFLL